MPDDEPRAIRYAGAPARLRALDPGGLPADTGPAPSDVRAFLGLARALGVSVPAGADAALVEPAEWRGPDHVAGMLRADWRWLTMTARTGHPPARGGGRRG